MTRKDYVALSAAIASGREARPGSATSESTFYQIANSVADVLAKDNTRFDRNKFLCACGLTNADDETT